MRDSSCRRVRNSGNPWSGTSYQYSERTSWVSRQKNQTVSGWNQLNVDHSKVWYFDISPGYAGLHENKANIDISSVSIVLFLSFSRVGSLRNLLTSIGQMGRGSLVKNYVVFCAPYLWDFGSWVLAYQSRDILTASVEIEPRVKKM